MACPGGGRFGQTKNCSKYNEAIGTIIRVGSIKWQDNDPKV